MTSKSEYVPLKSGGFCSNQPVISDEFVLSQEAASSRDDTSLLELILGAGEVLFQALEANGRVLPPQQISQMK
jgi:hypothetical protein